MCAKLCTHHLPIVGVVSTGVAISPGVEVWQSCHRALEVVLLDTAEGGLATGQDNSVCQLYCTCFPVNVGIYPSDNSVLHIV